VEKSAEIITEGQIPAGIHVDVFYNSSNGLHYTKSNMKFLNHNVVKEYVNKAFNSTLRSD